MTLRNAFEGLATETTLAGVLGKLPDQQDGRHPVTVDPDLLEQLSALRMAIASLTRTIGMTLPDTLGRQRVNVETGSIGVSSLPTLANVTTLATLTNLINQQQMGSFAANDEIPALMRISAQALRSNITVTA